MIERISGIDRAVARLLSWGTALASLLIALGLAASPSVAPGTPEHLVMAGVAVILALPVLRVALLGLSFVRSGDRDLAAVAVIVLAVIAIATAIGATGG